MPSQLIKEATPEGRSGGTGTRRRASARPCAQQRTQATATRTSARASTTAVATTAVQRQEKPTRTATIQKKHKSTTCRLATCAKGQRCPFVREYGKPKKPPAATLVVEEGAGVCVLDFEFREKGNLVAARSAGATTSASVNGTRGRISRG